MLPKGLYELLPYLYMLCGGLAIIEYGGVAMPLGTLLYLFGAWVWGVRSDRRRRSAKQRRRDSGRPFWNQTFYELLPFIYILCGIFMLELLEHEIRLVSGPLMIATGGLLVLIRYSERRKFRRSLPESNADPVDRFAAATMSWPDNVGIATLVPEHIEPEAEPEVVLTPQSDRCSGCAIRDICAGVPFKNQSISEIMRLSQTVSPDEAYELYRSAVERIEGQRVDDEELLPVVKKMHAYAGLCATWRNTGRHG